MLCRLDLQAYGEGAEKGLCFEKQAKPFAGMEDIPSHKPTGKTSRACREGKDKLTFHPCSPSPHFSFWSALQEPSPFSPSLASKSPLTPGLCWQGWGRKRRDGKKKKVQEITVLVYSNFCSGLVCVLFASILILNFNSVWKVYYLSVFPKVWVRVEFASCLHPLSTPISHPSAQSSLSG